jgi:hypothetical protein
MSPLAAELLRILEAEAGHPPLSADSLQNVLHAIGYGTDRVPLPEIEAAVGELLAAGQVEVAWRFGVPRWRVPRAAARAEGSMSSP